MTSSARLRARQRHLQDSKIRRRNERLKKTIREQIRRMHATVSGCFNSYTFSRTSTIPAKERRNYISAFQGHGHLRYHGAGICILQLLNLAFGVEFFSPVERIFSSTIRLSQCLPRSINREISHVTKRSIASSGFHFGIAFTLCIIPMYRFHAYSIPKLVYRWRKSGFGNRVR